MSANRKVIEAHLIEKVPDTLSPIQKKNKIGNILSGLRRAGVIENIGNLAKPKWILKK